MSGKKFSPCPIGTTCYASVGSFLKHIGLYKKIRVSNLSHGEQVSYLKDGKIDGYAPSGRSSEPLGYGGGPDPARPAAQRRSGGGFQRFPEGVSRLRTHDNTERDLQGSGTMTCPPWA